jgi:hypothetical protein
MINHEHDLSTRRQQEARFENSGKSSYSTGSKALSVERDDFHNVRKVAQKLRKRKRVGRC